MQEDELRRSFAASFPIEDIETIDVDALEQHTSALRGCNRTHDFLLYRRCANETARSCRHPAHAESCRQYSALAIRVRSQSQDNPVEPCICLEFHRNDIGNYEVTLSPESARRDVLHNPAWSTPRRARRAPRGSRHPGTRRKRAG